MRADLITTRTFHCGLTLALLLVLTNLAGCATAPLALPDVELPDYVAPLSRAGDGAPRPVLALVLGGGASRGFAHVGAIRELERSGFSPSIVVGTSAGSFVGALYAGGNGGDALLQIAEGMREDELRDVVLPDRGFVRGALLQDFVNRRLDNRPIEQLSRRFAAVATDLATGESVLFNRGNTGMAVRASSSVPGVFQPVSIRNRDFVDGGLASPVPVRAARQMGADVVIAVDVARRPEHAGALKSTVDIIIQSIAIMGRYVGHDERAEADVLIEPDVSAIGNLDFDKRHLAIEAGEQAVRKALPAIRAAMDHAARKIGP